MYLCFVSRNFNLLEDCVLEKNFDKNEFIKTKFKTSFEIVYTDFMCQNVL